MKITITEKELRDIIRRAVNEEIELITEYARVGFIGGKNNLEVYIHTDDPGYIPHMHIRDYATKGKVFDACVELGENKYFSHGSHKDKLNAKQRKDLADFMESPCINPKFSNNYELAVDMWNLNNSSQRVEFNGTVPNYRTISD